MLLLLPPPLPAPVPAASLSALGAGRPAAGKRGAQVQEMSAVVSEEGWLEQGDLLQLPTRTQAPNTTKESSCNATCAE